MRKHFFLPLLCNALLLWACNSPKQSSSGNQPEDSTAAAPRITEKKWKLIELAGKPVQDKINDKEPFLQLAEADQRFSASAGCNGLGGTYELRDNGRVRFKMGMSTLMACDHMEMEQGLTKALEAADNYTISGDTLSLNKARMAPLARFRYAGGGTENNALNGTWELNYISGPRIAFEGLYPRKRPTITFQLPQTSASGNSSCNNYNIAFTIDGNSIQFKDPASTKMACEGTGEATFFNTLKTVNRFDVVDGTLHFIMGDIAVMRFERK
ncbi:META domain-containing protein [Niabella beijingensis]|uniref:META domain-containing protein n=1 Tax=Niabella beijingensis TaxID=2872700 RepID=UPI001CBC0121|nr:META domain-containing protein [Niabella beijingensis]MBZ4190974.1 META domain-containing protein [Niabella beijingensis]